MAKIGMAFSRPDLDAALADHFGKAKWLMVVSSPTECEVVQNEVLNGVAVTRELALRGCTDVVVRHVGPGAYAHLKAAGIRVWRAAPDVTGRGQLRLLEAGALPAYEPDQVPGPGVGHRGGGHHGGGRRRPPLLN